MVIIDMSFLLDNVSITDYFVLPANVYEILVVKQNNLLRAHYQIALPLIL